MVIKRQRNKRGMRSIAFMNMSVRCPWIRILPKLEKRRVLNISVHAVHKIIKRPNPRSQRSTVAQRCRLLFICKGNSIQTTHQITRSAFVDNPVERPPLRRHSFLQINARINHSFSRAIQKNGPILQPIVAPFRSAKSTALTALPAPHI